MASSPKSYSGEQESGFDFKQGAGRYENKEKRFMIRWKSGKKVDPRLLMVLERFRQLHEEREEFFKKIFPGHHDEFVDVFKKVGAVMSRKKERRRAKAQTMQRSLSLGSPRDIDASELVNQRFKVKTPAVVVAAVAGQGGASSSTVSASSQGGTTSKGSK